MNLHRAWTVTVSSLGAALAVAACNSTVDGVQSPGFRESASATLVSGLAAVVYQGKVLQGRLAVRNTSGARQPIAWTSNGCDTNTGVRLRVYRLVGGQQLLAWDSSLLPAQPGCPDQTIRGTLAPGDSVVFQETYHLDQVLGDSLPAGSYVVTVTSGLVAPELPRELPMGTLTLDDRPLVPPGTNLNGTWEGGVDGVYIALSLTWTADSVYGSGRYATQSPITLGCGFEESPDSGTVQLEARRRGDYIGGEMSFDGRGGPPYAGVLDSATHLTGVFFSVDTGNCPFDIGRPV